MKLKALNVICWGSGYHVMIPLTSMEPRAVRKAYETNWLRFLGAPRFMKCDLGTEFPADFKKGAELDGTEVDPASLESPTQNAITERSGKTVQIMVGKTGEQVGCEDREDLERILDECMLQKNRLMTTSGFSPMQRVLGYQPKMPGGILTGGQNDLANISMKLRLEMCRSCRPRACARQQLNHSSLLSVLRRSEKLHWQDLDRN